MKRKDRHIPNRPKKDRLGGSKNISDKQENRLAEKSGGRRQPASGALPFAKGDVITGELLIEAKATSKKSLSVKKSWLEKITMEAERVQRVPCLAIHFDDANNFTEEDWACVPFSWLMFVLDRLEDISEEI